MNMLGYKMYVITMLDLMPAIPKLPKVLAFRPPKAKFSSQICCSSTEAHNISMNIFNGDEGNGRCQWSLTKLCGLHGSLVQSLTKQSSRDAEHRSISR